MMFVRRYVAAVGRSGIIAMAVLLVSMGGWAAAADEPGTRIEVELTESFYRALRAEGNKTYSTDKSEEYLRQIAVSARYAVESNLEIVRQQERIIELLEKLNQQKK